MLIVPSAKSKAEGAAQLALKETSLLGDLVTQSSFSLGKQKNLFRIRSLTRYTFLFF